MKEATLHIDLDSILYNYRHLKCYYNKKVIVIGNEANGVKQELQEMTDSNIKIEINEKLESFLLLFL